MIKLRWLFFFILSGMSMTYAIEDGVYAAALTPLHSDLSCNHEVLAKHCLQLIDRGCKGIVLFGTTGEGPSFSVDERKETIKKVISRGLDPKKIIVANGSSCLKDTVELTLAALEYNCSACLIAPPCFFKNVTDEGVIAFYREVIQRVSNPHLQVILYHIPKYSGVPITVNIVKTLCEEFPGIVIGIKESEGNISLTKEILKTVPQFKVFVGKEKQIPLAVSCGASGTMCGMANVWPELICSLYDRGNSPELEPIFLALENRPFIACCKALLADKKNPNWRLVRPPLVSLSAEESDLLKQKVTPQIK